MSTLVGNESKPTEPWNESDDDIYDMTIRYVARVASQGRAITMKKEKKKRAHRVSSESIG